MLKQSGFTLIEMAVVLAIVGIVAAIAIPNYITHRQNRQLSRAARDVYSSLQDAKMVAIRDNISVVARFTPGEAADGFFIVFEDDDDDNTYDAGERSFCSGEMPPGVTLASTTFSYTNPVSGTTTADVTRFTSLGMTTDADGLVSFTNGIRSTEVVVGLAGDIRVN